MAVTVRTLQNFIAGEWVDATSDEAREIVSPVTGEKLADAPNASEEDVVRAARAARDAQPKWAALSAWDRAEAAYRDRAIAARRHGHRHHAVEARTRPGVVPTAPRTPRGAPR